MHNLSYEIFYQFTHDNSHSPERIPPERIQLTEDK